MVRKGIDEVVAEKLGVHDAVLSLLGVRKLVVRLE